MTSGLPATIPVTAARAARGEVIVGDANACVGQQAADKFGLVGANRRHDMLRQLVSVRAHLIGQLPGPIDQHSAALASHAAASCQKIKKGFPQVFGKIGIRHDWGVPCA